MEFSEDFDWITLDEIVDDIATMRDARDAAIRDEPYRLVRSNEDLERETERIIPVLEEVCGEPAEDVLGADFMTRFERRFAGGASFYNFVMPFLRSFGVPLARINPKYLAPDDKGKPVHANLAHELAHCASTNESATMLRGIEINARLALKGDTSHRYACYSNILSLAYGAAALKAVNEKSKTELFERASSELDAEGRRSLGSWLAYVRRNTYDAWIYYVLPYKAFRKALRENSEYIEVAQPPSFSKESMLLSSVAVLRRLTGRAKEQPIHMPASIALYKQAKEPSD